MSNLMVNITQMQAVMLLAQAQTSLTLAVQALQQAIAGAQAAGASTVTLSNEMLQSLIAQISLASDALERVRANQQQMAMVRIREDNVNIMVRARQMQIVNILARERARLNVTVQSLQRLISTAQAMGAPVTLTLADAQQLLATLQASFSAVAQAAALQTQNIMVSVPQG